MIQPHVFGCIRRRHQVAFAGQVSFTARAPGGARKKVLYNDGRRESPLCFAESAPNAGIGAKALLPID
jgi:hypothetical protein